MVNKNNLSTNEITSFNNNKRLSVMIIPSSTSYKYFRRNCKRTQWIEMLKEAMTSDRGDHNETGIQWLIRHLGKSYKYQFISAARALQLPVLSNTIDTVSTLAMWEDANIGTCQQIIIMKHLRHYFGTRLIVPEVKVSVLSKLKVLDPITGSYTKTDTNEKIYYWYRDVDESICHILQTKYNSRQELELDFNRIDIIIGGDHGQGKFRMMMKLILRGDDMKDTIILKLDT